MANRRVVVTGLGLVSPLGHEVKTVWEKLVNGQSGIATMEYLVNSDLPTKISGCIADFDSSKAMLPKEARRVDLFVQYAAEAARQAIEDSGIEITEALAPRAGTAIGAGIGGLPWIEKSYEAMLKNGPRKISPFFIPGAIINMAAGFVSMKHNLQGPNIAIVTACTTGAHNIGHAMRMITHGDADVMVAGGTEMATSLLGIGGFSAARALSKRNDEPEKASRPWDRDRDGFVLGEGAGIVVLEELEHAKARGADIYAECVGFGMSSDAYHMTSPEPSGRGFVQTLQNTLNDAGVNPDVVNYINAHGTSTPVGDPIEAKAIKDVFGDHAYNLAVSSTKSMTGHMLGAAGSAEMIFSALAIKHQVAPPTINLDNPDEGCDLNFVPHTAQEMEINYALSNSFGFGGTNGSLLLKKYDG